jgi:hypothetical protein
MKTEARIMLIPRELTQQQLLDVLLNAYVKGEQAEITEVTEMIKEIKRQIILALSS